MSAAISTEQVSIERIDDIPLLVALQKQIGLAEVIDQAIPRHWLHQGLSIGQIAIVWNTFILSQADHRKVTVREWVTQHQALLEECLGAPLRDTDFTDDRLSQVLTPFSDDGAWQAIENHLWLNEVSVYRLKPERVRLDATVANGYHTVTEESLMQYGYNSNDNNQPQVKVMAASADIGSNGHLVATDVVSGQKADAPLYQPVLERMRQTEKEPGLLYMGDSKMSALAIRADIVAHGDFYLVPLSKVGEVPQLLSHCIERVVEGDQTATLIFDSTSQIDSPCLIAAGYETTRSQSDTSSLGRSITWDERLLVIRSTSDAIRQTLLNKRLKEATEELLVLTPPPGRGRQQIRSETQLLKRAEAILQRFGVKDFLHYTFRREECIQTQYIGRGRGGVNRQKRTLTTVRYQITQVQRDETAIAAAQSRMGWRLYATNHESGLFPIEKAILLYRQAPRIERHFHLFKGAPVGLEPLYVRRDDQIKGLVRLLSLCVRLLTLLEIVARRSLAQRGEKLSGLYEGNPKQQTDQPTATRLLKAFRHISRVQMQVAGQCLSYRTPLSPLQRQILSLLELSETIYEVPVRNSG